MNVKIMELKHTILDKNAEISRLKVELEEAHTELAISIKERIDLGNQLAEASKAATDMEDALHEATSEFTKQLAEARAELERYKETIANMELLLCRPKSCQKHQEVARECIKILRDYNGVEGIADRIMKHFGLEG